MKNDIRKLVITRKPDFYVPMKIFPINREENKDHKLCVWQFQDHFVFVLFLKGKPEDPIIYGETGDFVKSCKDNEDKLDKIRFLFKRHLFLRCAEIGYEKSFYTNPE